MRLIKALITAPLIAMLLGNMTAYASQTYSTEVINNIAIGQVAIQIDEFELNSRGEEIPYVDNKKVVPGQTVSKIVRVTNLGNDAWIRIKAEFFADMESMVLSYGDLVLADDKWKKCGDYYYYTDPVYRGNHVDFIKQVRIPPTWNESTSDKTTGIHFSSDAVQLKNFEPDFSSDDPWFGTLIEQRIYVPFTPSNATKANYSVEFENGAEGFVRVGDDFFKHWGTLLPGDTVTGEVHVGNNYKYPVEIFFHTETLADDALLKQCHLTIRNGNTVIYDGPLSGALDEISLGKFYKGDSAIMTYSLYVPKELTNIYALTETLTKWVWTAKLNNYSGGGGGGGGGRGGSGNPPKNPPGEDIVVIPPDTPTPTGQTPPPGVPAGVNSVNRTPGTAGESRTKTGDNNVIMLGVIAMLVSIGGITALIVTRKRKGGH